VGLSARSPAHLIAPEPELAYPHQAQFAKLGLFRDRDRVHGSLRLDRDSPKMTLAVVEGQAPVPLSQLLALGSV
jgi:hypothetical protein